MNEGERGWFDPDFCEHHCPICTRARKGNRLARFLQRIELLVTLGGCPWGRARQRKYGVRPNQPAPPDVSGRETPAAVPHDGTRAPVPKKSETG